MEEIINKAIDAIDEGGMTFDAWRDRLYEQRIEPLSAVIGAIRGRPDVRFHFRVVDGVNVHYVERVSA